MALYPENLRKRIGGLFITLVALAVIGGFTLLIELLLANRRKAPWVPIVAWGSLAILTFRWLPLLSLIASLNTWTILLSMNGANQGRHQWIRILSWGAGAIGIVYAFGYDSL